MHYSKLACCFFAWLYCLAIPLTQAQTQTQTNYPIKPLSAEDIARKAAIPEWQARSTKSASLVQLPQGVDNSTSAYFPAIFNQRGNSCSQASGVRYVFSYEVNRMLNREAKASTANVFSYHFTWNFLNNGIDEGSHPELGYDMIKVGGAATLQLMPDESAAVSATTWLTGYDKYLESMKYRVAKYEKFSLKTAEGVERLKHYLYNRGEEGSAGGIVTFSCKSSNWKERTYSGSSVTNLKDIIVEIGTEGAHALTIVGYDDTVEYDLNKDGVITEDEKGAFIVANSWGTGWGTNGRCYYPYKLFLTPAGQGGLADLDAMALMLEPEQHQPQIVFKIKVKYTSRNDLLFRLGVADGENASQPSLELYYPMMMNQGGDHPMRGEGTLEEYKTIEFAMNFTDKLPDFEHFTQPKYFLKLRKIAAGKEVGEGQVIGFSVLDYRTGKEYTSAQTNVPITGETLLSTYDSTTPAVSASKYSWLQTNGSTVVKTPFVLKTAEGKQIKLQFEDYDKTSGKLQFKFQELPK